MLGRDVEAGAFCSLVNVGANRLRLQPELSYLTMEKSKRRHVHTSGSKGRKRSIHFQALLCVMGCGAARGLLLNLHSCLKRCCSFPDIKRQHSKKHFNVRGFFGFSSFEER